MTPPVCEDGLSVLCLNGEVVEEGHAQSRLGNPSCWVLVILSVGVRQIQGELRMTLSRSLELSDQLIMYW